MNASILYHMAGYFPEYKWQGISSKALFVTSSSQLVIGFLETELDLETGSNTQLCELCQANHLGDPSSSSE